ncbi:protein translocase subunit SecA [Clostridium oryzae]|uniref:Protein translocase subunit SecA n=1 Tax=Clostridium oryzae TaxID=1450648 RepID=A0A1V4IZ75_9CLOT|nr:protein translocase subunit SecA [Clostridium oryzae]
MSGAFSIFGSYSEREIKRLKPIINKIDSFGNAMEGLTDDELKAKTDEFRKRIEDGEGIDRILPEAFAVVREAAYRVLKMKHYEVQLMGGIILHQGRIAEMKTGEGKTLVATLPAYLNALEGKGVHIITTNDYLAERDRNEMGQIFEFLGLTVGVILHDMEPEQRRAAYNADITYGTNNELGFDYLRDNMAVNKEERVQRGLYYAIVDEIDSILIDEARTPLIIAGEGDEPSDIYYTCDKLVKTFKKGEHFSVDEKRKAVTLDDAGIEIVENTFGLKNYADIENRLIQHHIIQALKANYTMLRDRDYIVKDDEVIIVDEFTGRVMEGRRFSEGLHEAIEAKEGMKINNESKTLATITLQNYFKIYEKLSGMTGTAATEEMEFREIYNLDVVVIPTNKPIQRIDYDDVVYRTTRAKYNAIINEIEESYKKGQPVLVGTSSVAKSEDISFLLKRKGIKHNVLNAKNHAKEAKIVEKAGQLGAVTIATNMAGRGTDIKLGEGVAEVGGLKVIGTDKHESRRIDNQLRGRSGRQGDPGCSRFIISLEDELMERFVPERFKELYDKIAENDSMPLQSKWVTRAVETAQKSVEGDNFYTRKNLVSYDDVVNVQRQIIYDERNKVLDGEDVEEDILDMAKTVINKTVTDYVGTQEEEEEADEFKQQLDKIISATEDICIDKGSISADEMKKMSNAEIENLIYEKAMDIYEKAKQKLGEEEIKSLGRVILLKVVDEKWVDHIDDMEFLKQGIGLRSYKQVDPVQCFQMEASEMFDSMVYSIKFNTVRNLFLNLLARLNGNGQPEELEDDELDDEIEDFEDIDEEEMIDESAAAEETEEQQEFQRLLNEMEAIEQEETEKEKEAETEQEADNQ